MRTWLLVIVTMFVSVTWIESDQVRAQTITNQVEKKSGGSNPTWSNSAATYVVNKNGGSLSRQGGEQDPWIEWSKGSGSGQKRYRIRKAVCTPAMWKLLEKCQIHERKCTIKVKNGKLVEVIARGRS